MSLPDNTRTKVLELLHKIERNTREYDKLCTHGFNHAYALEAIRLLTAPALSERFKEGDRVAYWFDTGMSGVQAVNCIVLKIGKKKIRVRNEFGKEEWKYPGIFTATPW